MAAIAAVFAGASAADGAGQQVARAEALKLSTAYESNGHGGKQPRRPSGIAGVRRAAKKKRNQARHRAHCRGKR